VYVTPKSPKGGTKRDVAVFASKIQLLSKKKSATKFLCVKTSSGEVVATSYIYLTVYRWIMVGVPIHLKFALKVTQPCRKRRLRHISLNSAAAVRDSGEKVQLSVIGSRQLSLR